MDEYIKKRTIRNIIIFIIVVITCGWFGRVLDLMMGDTSYDDGSLGMLLFLISPLITTIMLRAFAKDGWKDIGLNFYLKGNIKWYIVSLVIYPIMTAIILLIGNVLGWIYFDSSKISIYVYACIASFVSNFFKNIPEEFVWRGYITPKARLIIENDFILYIVVGLVWGLWHAPYYLFFLDSASFNSVTSLSRCTFIPVATLTMIAWAIPYTELRLLTKSSWPGVLMHTIEDTFLNTLIFVGVINISQARELWISPIYGLISISLYIVLGLILRKIRKKSEIKQDLKLEVN